MKIKLSFNLDNKKFLRKYILLIYGERILGGSFIVALYITFILWMNSYLAKNLNVLKIGIIFIIIFSLYSMFLFKF